MSIVKPDSSGAIPDTQNIQVVPIRGSNFGSPEISSPSGGANSSATNKEFTDPVIESGMQHRFNSAVDQCRGINGGRGHLHGRKTELLQALDASNELYHTVKACPELVNHLRQLDLLQDRTRKLSEGKIHLLCVYCAMQPISEDDYKSCSDYTAYLIQAEYEEKSSDDFMDWAKKQTLKGCLGAVRARKRKGRLADPAQDATAQTEFRLLIRRGAKGVRGLLNGDEFKLSEDTLAAIIDLIEAERSEKGVDAGNSIGGADA